jgi:hypothetical protein
VQPGVLVLLMQTPDSRRSPVRPLQMGRSQTFRLQMDRLPVA